MIRQLPTALRRSISRALCQGRLSQHAKEYRAQLVGKILPYWLQTIDPNHGGFLLSDDAIRGPSTPKEKQLATQARMVWAFSHAHLHGLGNEGHCLEAAENGYRFVTEKFRDPNNGGYFWKTDISGKTINNRKILYGQSFVIYALIEYHRAVKREEPLCRAMELYRLIQDHAHDQKNRGWIEHFAVDWKPLGGRDSLAEVEVIGYKSANTHLHLQESLAELYEATRDSGVKESVEEVLEINKRYFYSNKAGHSSLHRRSDWSKVTDASSVGLSYGHNVEFAHLMIRTENILGKTEDWPHFYAQINHALKFGYDHRRGGLFYRGMNDHPAYDTTKVWWPQAEMMSALTDALRHQENARQRRALHRLLEFINQFQADKRDSIWLNAVTKQGQPTDTSKAHNWKDNYHELRALVKFTEAFLK
jgi:mannose/cellobiose epimerase-like protein (N-acyl-D-glucosamine 2-epimerase family)